MHSMPGERSATTRPVAAAFPRCLAAVLALLSTLALVSPAPTLGQAPGYPQLNPGAVRAEYLAEVLDRINELLADWGDTWSRDLPDELADLYHESAVLIPPNGPVVRGRSAIRDYFVDALPEHGHIEAFMLDFDASGEMSQVFGNYMLGIQQGAEAGTQKSGPMITVYVRRGRTWLIRSQIFLSADAPR
jgi:ketosteroid isomerase-like protein